MKAINFKDFFKQKFFTEDKKYINAFMPVQLFEMAMRGDVAKRPIRIDNDDIEFLQQFPPELWGRALHARYHDDLYTALKGREGLRDEKRQELTEKIKQALVTQNFDSLQGLLPNHTLRSIRSEYGPEWAHEYRRKGNLEKAAFGAASDLVYYAVEEAVPDAPAEAPRVYEFRTQGKGVRRIKAKPYINRLIHKLERTKGHEHSPHTDLQRHGHDVGQYGYDLHGVKEGRPKKKTGDSDIPHSTQGMQMPSSATTVDRMKDFLATNAHRIYGELPEPGQEVELPSGEKAQIKGYKPVQAGKGGKTGGEHAQDSFIRQKYQNPLESKYYTLLGLANAPFKTLSGEEINPTKFPSNDKKRSEAVRLAQQDIEWLKRNGQISGPPIPGHNQHWKGIPFDQKQIVHLPHFDKEIIEVDKDGREIPTRVEMPYVKPAEYFRSIGSLPEDYERDEEGKIIIDQATGQPKLSIPAEQKRGYQKDYVGISPDEYDEYIKSSQRKGIYASGALSVNHNTSGIQPLEYGHKDYRSRSAAIFGPEPGSDEPKQATAMKASPLDRSGESGLFYDDIIKGIRKCLTGRKCGEATTWERNIGLNNIEEIHQIIVQKMQQNLRDPDMLVSKKRENFAFTQTSSIMQQDHEGGQTRRKRILDPKLRQTSMDRATKSGDTGEESSSATQDLVTQKLKDKGIFKDELGGVINRKYMSGYHKFPYNLGNMRILLDELQQEAGEADTESQVAKDRSRQDVGQEVIGLLRKSMQDKKLVALQIFELIKKMLEVDGYTTNVESVAEDILGKLTKDAHTAAQLVANFANHPLTKKYADPDEQGGQQSQPQAQSGGKDPDFDLAVDKLWSDYLDRLPTDDDDKIVPNEQMKQGLLPQGGEKVSILAKTIARNFPEKEEAIAKHVQDAIYDALDISPPSAAQPVQATQSQPKQPIPIRPEQPQAAAAKSVGTVSARDRAMRTPDWNTLKNNKDYLALAFHQKYLSRLTRESIMNLRGWIEKNKDGMDQEEYRQAILNLDEELESLG